MTDAKQVAETILAQLGGNKFRVMTGASSFLSGNVAKDGEPIAFGLSFKLPRARRGITNVVVKLNARDLYDVEFGKIVRSKDPESGYMIHMDYKIVTDAQDIGVEQLREVFERATGLLTSL